MLESVKHFNVDLVFIDRTIVMKLEPNEEITTKGKTKTIPLPDPHKGFMKKNHALSPSCNAQECENV